MKDIKEMKQTLEKGMAKLGF